MAKGRHPRPADAREQPGGGPTPLGLRPMDLPRFLLRGGILAALGRGTAIVTTLVTVALITRLLPPSGAGLYFLLLSIATVATACGQLGLHRIVVQQLGVALAHQDPALARSTVVRVTGLALVGGLVVALFLAVGPGLLVIRLLGGAAGALLMALVGVWTLGKVMGGTVAEVFRGFRQIGHAMLFRTVVSGTMLICALLVLLMVKLRLTWRPGIDHVVACAAVSGLVAAAWGLSKLFRQLRSYPRSQEVGPSWSQLLSWSWPVLLTNLVAMIWEASGMWILSSTVRDQAELALYGSAWRASRLVVTPLMVTNVVLMPVIAEYCERRELSRLTAALRFTATLATLPALLLVLAFILVHEPIMGALFGPYYRDAGMLLVLLGIGQLSSVFSGACGITLLMSGRQTLHLVLNLISLVPLLVAGVLLTRRFGGLGMAMAVMLGMLLQQVLFIVGVRLKVGIWTHATFDPGSMLRFYRMLPGFTDKPRDSQPGDDRSTDGSGSHFPKRC